MPVSEGENADFIEESGSADILPAGCVRNYLRFNLPITKQQVGMPAGGVRNYLRFNSPVAKQQAAESPELGDVSGSRAGRCEMFMELELQN